MVSVGTCFERQLHTKHCGQCWACSSRDLVHGVSDTTVGWDATNSVYPMPGGRGSRASPHLHIGEGQVRLPVILQQLLPKSLSPSELRSCSAGGTVRAEPWPPSCCSVLERGQPRG